MADLESKKKQDELSFAEVIYTLQKWWRYLLSHWVFIAMLAATGAIGGFVYASMQKAVYTANYTFMLEEEGGSSLGAYSGLASMVGIDLGGAGGTNSMFKGENIFEVYRSRRMIMKTLLTPVNFGTGKPELLIDRYIRTNDLKEEWKADPELSKLNFSISPERFKTVHDSVITSIVDEINQSQLTAEKPDKKMSTIRISMEARDPLFAKEFVEHLVDNVNTFYKQTKTKKTSQNVQSLQRRADSIKRVLGLSIGRTASAIDANPNANVVLKSLEVSSQKKQIDVEANSVIYQEIVKNLEITKLALAKETPLIQDIDPPVLPLKKTKPRILVYLPLYGFFGALIAVIILVIRKIWQDEVKVLM